MAYHIGVDIGTTAVKVVGFDFEGNVLAMHSGSYEMQHPEPGWSEQNPEEIFFAVVSNINAVYQQLSPAEPVAISFSAAMHSLIAVDEKGMPLTQCMIWADNRADAIAERFKKSNTGRDFYKRTGVPVHPMTPLCKIVWLKENQTDVFDAAFKFIGIKEYVLFRLTGKFVCDTAIASATGLLNLAELQWDKHILDYIGLSEDKLPQLLDVKAVVHISKADAGSLLQIPENTALVMGASDGAAANLSIGVFDEDVLVVTIGTSSAVRLLSNESIIDDQMRTFSYHARDEYYINGGASNNGAVVLNWLRNDLIQSGSEMARFLDQANEVAPGSDGLIFLPFILGERAPVWNAHAHASFIGLTVTHTRAHLIRAALEAVIFATYSIGKILLERKQVRTIYATGGFARNRDWVQMLSDVFNLPVILSSSEESSAWGAVLTGMLATGTPMSSAEKFFEMLTPDVERHKVYAAAYEKYEELTEAMKKFFV